MVGASPQHEELYLSAAADIRRVENHWATAVPWRFWNGSYIR